MFANSSADMLLYDRSPLSSLGRFLVRDGSESSIESRRGGLGPAEMARTGVEGAPNEAISMTLFLLETAAAEASGTKVSRSGEVRSEKGGSPTGVGGESWDGKCRSLVKREVRNAARLGWSCE